MSEKCVGAEGEAVNPRLNFRTCKQAKDWFRLPKETLLIVWFSGNAEQKVVIGYNYVFAAKPWLRGSQKAVWFGSLQKSARNKRCFSRSNTC